MRKWKFPLKPIFPSAYSVFFYIKCISRTQMNAQGQQSPGVFSSDGWMLTRVSWWLYQTPFQFAFWAANGAAARQGWTPCHRRFPVRLDTAQKQKGATRDQQLLKQVGSDWETPFVLKAQKSFLQNLCKNKAWGSLCWLLNNNGRGKQKWKLFLFIFSFVEDKLQHPSTPVRFPLLYRLRTEKPLRCLTPRDKL